MCSQLDIRNSLHSSPGTFAVGDIKKTALEDKLRRVLAEQAHEINDTNLQYQQTIQNNVNNTIQLHKMDLLDLMNKQDVSLQAQFDRLEERLRNAKKSINSNVVNLEEETKAINSKFEAQIRKVQTSLTQYKSSIAVKFSDMKEAIDEQQKQLEENFHAKLVSIGACNIDEDRYEKKLIALQIESWKRSVEQCWMQYEDVEQYVLLYKQQYERTQRELGLIMNKYTSFISEYHLQCKENQEQHYYLDEEMKWLKTLVQEQYQSLATLRENTSQQINSILLVIHAHDDTIALRKEYEVLVNAMMEQAKKYILLQATYHALPYGNQHHTHGISATIIKHQQDKYSKQLHSLQIAMIGLVRKVVAFVSFYCDQEYLLYTFDIDLTGVAEKRIKHDYNNDFLHVCSQPDVQVDQLREKCVMKMVRELEIKLADYIHLHPHTQPPRPSTSPSTSPLPLSLSDQRQPAHAIHSANPSHLAHSIQPGHPANPVNNVSHPTANKKDMMKWKGQFLYAFKHS